jgi:septum formation protein
MKARLVLASGSASRRLLLAQAGVQADYILPHVDEDTARRAMRAEGMKVRDQAMRLAELKSMKVSLAEPGLVIGADQMLSLADKAFDKPVSLDAARDQLKALAGKTHTLETALVISENGSPVWRYLARPRLTMRVFSEAFLESYLQRHGDKLLSSVGAYQLEGEGAQLFSHIEGDYFSILGLPLLPLLDYLRSRGVLET